MGSALCLMSEYFTEAAYAHSINFTTSCLKQGQARSRVVSSSASVSDPPGFGVCPRPMLPSFLRPKASGYEEASRIS
jgi:hypothetical protein